MCGRFSIIAFQTAWWDDLEKLFGSQGFGLSVDAESQMAVLFGNTECKDLFQVEEAADDVFPLFVVNGLDLASVMRASSIFRFESKGEATSGETGREDNRKETS
jgi:hypothetical protein